MPRWTKPSEESPQVECGDRVVIIVRERPTAHKPFRNRLVILEATEHGWDSPDPTYAGYTVFDGVLWSLELDVTQIAEII